MTQDYLSWLYNYLNEIYKTPILENLLNFNVVELTRGKVKYSAEISEKHCNWYGFVHGGTLASISDVAMGVSCISLGKRVVTIDMSISYIKNAPSKNTITAIGEVISSGKTIMRAAGEVYCGEQLLVRSQASYFVTGDFTQEHPLP